MRKSMLILAAVLACGPPPTTPCLGPYRVDHPYRVDPLALRHNENLLVFLFSHGPAGALVADHDEFCSRFSGTPIHVCSTATFTCDPTSLFSGQQCLGEWDMVDGVRLAKGGSALAHEFLHVYEAQHWVLDTPSHPQWEAKGYYALASRYASAAAPVASIAPLHSQND